MATAFKPFAIEPTDLGQINVKPSKPNALWKVIVSAIRCPECGSLESKARTGKRSNSHGQLEHYRQCCDCKIRFRVVYE